jgi:hypothetical protein
MRVVKSGMTRWGLARMREMRSLCRILVRKPEKKRLLVIWRLRCHDVIKTDPIEIGYQGVHWIDNV